MRCTCLNEHSAALQCAYILVKLQLLHFDNHIKLYCNFLFILINAAALLKTFHFPELDFILIYAYHNLKMFSFRFDVNDTK